MGVKEVEERYDSMRWDWRAVRVREGREGFVGVGRRAG